MSSTYRIAMIEETIHYKDDPEKYMRVLEFFLKSREIYFNTFINTFLQQVAIIVALMIALLSLMSASVSNSVNQIPTALGYLTSGEIKNILLGIITLLPLFFNLIIILLLMVILVPGSLLIKTKWGQGKIKKWLGITLFEERMSKSEQLNLAKYEPEKWDIVVEVDREKKSVLFKRIQEVGIESKK